METAKGKGKIYTISDRNSGSLDQSVHLYTSTLCCSQTYLPTMASIRTLDKRDFVTSPQTHAIKKQEGQDGPVLLPDYQTSLESVGFLVQEKRFNIDFQDGDHLGYPIRMI